MGEHWVVPVYSLCPLSIIHTCWLIIWKRKYSEQWPIVFNITQINSWKDRKETLWRSSHSSLSFTVSNKPSDRRFFSFSWESLNYNRWVLSKYSDEHNVLEYSDEHNVLSQCFAKGRNYLFLLNIAYVSDEIIITMLRWPFYDWRENQWDCQHNAFLLL